MSAGIYLGLFLSIILTETFLVTTKETKEISGASYLKDAGVGNINHPGQNELHKFEKSHALMKPERFRRNAESLVSSLLWACSFESGNQNDFCGMIQDTSDQFDWTLTRDATPSDPTGPDFAQDGNYYIFIEASSPRLPNDEARLTLPRINNYSGAGCIDFYFHMYGFHVNTLKVLQISGSATVTLWTRFHDLGNVWYHAFVDVNIQSNVQFQIVASRGNEYSGDIALDKVQLTAGICR